MQCQGPLSVENAVVQPQQVNMVCHVTEPQTSGRVQALHTLALESQNSRSARLARTSGFASHCGTSDIVILQDTF